MSGAWVLLILIAIMIVFIFTVQAVARQREHPILTQKDVMEALKNKKQESDHENINKESSI